jgi:hypothetical protein
MTDMMKKLIAMISGSVPEGIALLFTRVALAGIFWRSARTKVEDGSWLQMSDTTVFLFREEYGMPWPEITGLLATYSNRAGPVYPHRCSRSAGHDIGHPVFCLSGSLVADAYHLDRSGRNVDRSGRRDVLAGPVDRSQVRLIR